MSRRFVAAIVVAVLILVTAGFIVTYIQKARMNSYRATTQNNLRQLSLFAAHHANFDPKKDDPNKVAREIPTGTVVLPGVPPENRLSWYVYVLPDLDQKRQDVVGLMTQINPAEPWSAARNQEAARTRLVVALSPLDTPVVAADQPGATCYVGIAGVGPDAATITLPPPPGRAPRAGAFRYDAVTPFDRIGDGLSQTLLLGETASDVGPWLRGGPSTVRGLDDGKSAKPLIGAGGQFGGYYPNGAYFAMCDGSVRNITPQVSRDVLLDLATIDGGNEAKLPGEQ